MTLLLAVLACSGDGVGPDPTSTGDTGVPISWQALPGPCEAPATLPTDPLTAGPRWEDDVIQSDDALVELVELEAHEDLGLFLAAGQTGLLSYDWNVATGELTWLSFFPENGHGRYERIEVLDDGWVAGASRAWHLEIIDLRDPSSPQTAWLIAESGYTGMHHRDGLLYAANQSGDLVTLEMQPGGSTQERDRVSGLGSPWEMVRVGDRLYVADQTLGVVVVDISSAQAPTVVGAVETASGALDLETDGAFLYVAVGAAGIQVFDLADPDQPASVALVETGSPVVSVSQADGLLWGADHEGVLVADIADPTAPVLLGFEDAVYYALHVEAHGDRAWVADWYDIPSFDLARGVESPAVRPSPSRVFLTRADEPATLTLYNGGAADLVLSGGAIDDDRVEVLISGTSAAPGETLLVSLVAGADGSDLDATLCLATNDPGTPLLEVPVGGGSWNTDLSAGGGGLQIGDPAPDFALEDLDGTSWRLSEQLGHPVVLIYFATW